MKKAVTALLIIAAVVPACALIINLAVILGSLPYIRSAEKVPECEGAILIPGSGVYANRPGAVLKDRLDCGIELYKSGKGTKLLMSGDGGGQYYDEVSVMVNYAAENGVPEEDIISDPDGFSTYASVYNAGENPEKTVIVVTQRYHLYRTVFIARRMGMKVTGVACENSTEQYAAYQHIREIFARIKDFYYAFTKPVPEPS